MPYYILYYRKSHCCSLTLSSKTDWFSSTTVEQTIHLSFPSSLPIRWYIAIHAQHFVQETCTFIQSVYTDTQCKFVCNYRACTFVSGSVKSTKRKPKSKAPQRRKKVPWMSRGVQKMKTGVSIATRKFPVQFPAVVMETAAPRTSRGKISLVTTHAMGLHTHTNNK